MKITSILLACLVLTMGVIAQSPASVLKQAERALGGRKAAARVQNRVTTGKIREMATGATGDLKAVYSVPNFLYMRYDLDGIEFETGFIGRSAWERDSRNGLQTLTGERALILQAEALFRNSFWLNYKKERSKISRLPASEIDGKSVNNIRIRTVKDVAIDLGFESSTGILLSEKISSGTIVRSYSYSDHRNINGVSIPFSIRMQEDGRDLLLTVDNISTATLSDREIFDFPNTSSEPLPDLRELLEQLKTNQENAEKLLDEYSYTQKTTRRELGKDGVLRESGSETHQMSFYKGSRIRRLIEKDGKPLTARQQAEEDKDAEKAVAEIEKRIAKNDRQNSSRSGPPAEEGRRVSIAEVLKASSLLNPRRERFRGRSVIVFDFEPDPAFDLKNAKSMLKFFGKTAGVMWIDEQDKQVMRLEAYLFDSFKVGGGVLAKLKKGASFTLEQQKINDEVWLPSMADLNLSIRVLLVKGIDLNQMIRSYDYRKFSTEVKDAQVGKPETP